MILTAANHKYFHPLTQLIKNIRQKLPGYRLIVYDIGLTTKMRKYVTLTTTGHSNQMSEPLTFFYLLCLARQDV